MSLRTAARVVALVSGALLLVLTGLGGSYGGTMPMMPMGGMWMMRGPYVGTGSRPAVPSIAGAPEVRVQAENFTFSPSEVRVPKGTAANLTLVNPASTGVVHDFTVPALGIHVVAEPGQTATAGLRDLPAGRYPAFCSVPGHADLGMRASLVVE